MSCYMLVGYNDIKQRIKTLGEKLIPQGSHLLLYGSRARGDYNSNSDWDLLVLLNREHNSDDFDTISYPLMEMGFDMNQSFLACISLLILSFQYTKYIWIHIF